MRLLLLVTLLLTAGAAFSQTEADTAKKTHEVESMLLGWMTEDQLFEHFPEYKTAYQSYHPDSTAVEMIRGYKDTAEVVVFMGTWCKDTKRELPRLLKALHEAQNPRVSVQLYGLDRSKSDSTGLAEKHSIEFLPTFVVTSHGKELGRIVEKATMTVEKDFANILCAKQSVAPVKAP